MDYEKTCCNFSLETIELKWETWNLQKLQFSCGGSTTIKIGQNRIMLHENPIKFSKRIIQFVDLNQRTNFLRHMPKQVPWRFIKHRFCSRICFLLYGTICIHKKLAHVSTKVPVRKLDQVGWPTKFDLKEYKISPRGSLLVIMGVSETLDSKWLIPIFFDNLIMQRIRKGRQSGWKLRKIRKMRKGWIGAGSRRKLRWETND